MFIIPLTEAAIFVNDNIVVSAAFHVAVHASNEDIQSFIDSYGAIYDLFDFEEAFFDHFDCMDYYHILADNTSIHEALYDELRANGFNITECDL